jgi:peptide-methionine (S)-S-oxide reductase
MSLRTLTVSLGLAIAVGAVALTRAQDEEKPAPAQPKHEGESAKNANAKAKPARSTSKAKNAKGAAAKQADADVKYEQATFGGGCFWCLEAVFERLPGVKSVVSGYAGGTVPRPSYELVCTGTTGHAEVVQITFDPKKVSYEELLHIFFEFHDPTTINRQGPDEGTNYRSIILYHTQDQKKAAQQAYEEMTAAQVFNAPIVTELVPLKKFYPAERYHQDYYRRHQDEEYCQAYIVPKMIKLQAKLRAKQLQGTQAEKKRE